MTTIKWLLGIFTCAWLGQYVLALFVPHLAMEVLYTLGTRECGPNQLRLSDIPDESFRSIVRPSPDLLYAACFYDLADGPVMIEADIPARYWSMQFYQMNTENYAGISNQRDQRYRVGSIAKVTLIGNDQQLTDYSGEVIQSPTQRGIVLLRASAIGDIAQQRAALQASRGEAAEEKAND